MSSMRHKEDKLHFYDLRKILMNGLTYEEPVPRIKECFIASEIFCEGITKFLKCI